MQAVTTIGFDIAKLVFQVHGVDTVGQVIIRRQLSAFGGKCNVIERVLFLILSAKRCRTLGSYCATISPTLRTTFLKV